MGTELIALLLDCVVLIFLGVTIFFVFRLTKSLDNFKQHRQELDSVIANLLSSIDKAERSVQSLKLSSAEEAGRMESLISQAKSLSDELQIINQAGESMAVRLEKLAETNRKLVQPSHNKYQIPEPAERPKEKISSPVHKRQPLKKEEPSKSYGETLKRVPKEQALPEDDLPSFMIQDRDYNDVAASNDDAVNYDIDEEIDNLQSQAERELYEALRSGKKNITDGGS